MVFRCTEKLYSIFLRSWIGSAFVFQSVVCYISLDVPPRLSNSVERLSYHVLSNQDGHCFESGATALTSSVKNCFDIESVTDSSIKIQSKDRMVVTMEKCTGPYTSLQKVIRIGLNSLSNLQACTTYRLTQGRECSALIQTSFKAPGPVNKFRAFISEGKLNVTWRSDNSAMNCISHYEVRFTKGENHAAGHNIPVHNSYYTARVKKCQIYSVSVTSVDVKKKKSLTSSAELAVGDTTVKVFDKYKAASTKLPLFPYDPSGRCRGSVLWDEIRRSPTTKYNVQSPTDSTDSCKFSKPRYVWKGSRSVTIHWTFSCWVTTCQADCCIGPWAENCAKNQNEEWFCWPIRSNNTVLVTGRKLTQDKRYTCKVQAKVGCQKYEDTDYFYTRFGRPFKPGPVWVTNVASTSFTISWEPSPHTEMEPVDYYILTVRLDQPNYRYNPSCLFPNGVKVYNTTTNSPIPVSGLLPYFMHRVWVTAYNEFGYTSSDVLDVITKVDIPGPCEKVSLKEVNVNSTESDPIFLFKWSEPCRWNGQPRDTILIIEGRRPDNAKKNVYVTNFFHNYDNSFRFNATRDFRYTVALFARIEKDIKSRCAKPWVINIPPGLSSVTNNWSNLRPEVLTPDEGGTPLAAIPLYQNLLDDTNGTIKHVAIMVAEKGQEGPRERNYIPLPNWPNARNWNAAMTEDHVLLYQATPKYWNIPSFDDGAIHAYNLGSDLCVVSNESSTPPSSAEKLSALQPTDSPISATTPSLRDDINLDSYTNSSADNGDDKFYCNGPLRKNIEYVVRLRVFTAAGYCDSDEIFFRTGHISEEECPFYRQLWFYAIFPVFLVSVVITMIWIGRRRIGPNAVASAPSPDLTEAECKTKRRPCNRRRSISPEKLPAVVTRLLSQRGNLEKEFDELNEISADWASKVACSVGLMKENRLKNRYADVVPYDYNRVKLSSESTSQTDYINASYVKGFSMDTEYIACQGPTVETSNDFWQMVFDQKVCFIVMLTSLVENGMAKCSQYFSELSENKEWMDFTVKCSSRLDLSNYTVRELQLYKKTSSEKRSIQHFQFRDWPDFGCPNDIDGILEFCDALRGNLCLKGDSKTVVHCSAGVGRTGTLIALDILLQYVHYNRKVDIMRTVLRLREQRQWMVRTEVSRITHRRPHENWASKRRQINVVSTENSSKRRRFDDFSTASSHEGGTKFLS